MFTMLAVANWYYRFLAYEYYYICAQKTTCAWDLQQLDTLILLFFQLTVALLKLVWILMTVRKTWGHRQ